MTSEPIDRFATYVATLGRGPGRSRPLTRDEARDAMQILLSQQADPHQTGAFLMLLRYRGEDAQEIAGLVEGAEPSTRVNTPADLDWPSYGAGRTRGAPWFLLAALALAASGVRVLMHGTNEFSGGMDCEAGLACLGLSAARSAEDAAHRMETHNFAYVPARVLSPALAGLLGLRRLLGLRSPLNTVARLLNPAAAPAGVDGVFHPPYIETHLATAELLGRPRLLVLKGGGGEAERNPRRPMFAHLWNGASRQQIALPALSTAEPTATEPDFAAIWHGTTRDPDIEARITGTIALALLAMGRDMDAHDVWEGRLFFFEKKNL